MTAAQEKNWLDRILGLVSKVEAGEGISAVLLAANVFFLLGAYYVLKTVRESLILSEAGAEVTVRRLALAGSHRAPR